MPILAGFTDDVVDPSIPVAATSDIGTITATWTDPDGTVLQLSDNSDTRGYFTTYGIAGWGAPTFEYVADALASGGELVRFVRAQAARLTWPLHIWGDTHLQFIERYRAVRKSFLKTAYRGVPGRLTVYRPDGSARWVNAFYEEGFSGEAGQMHRSASPVLTLYCPDGYWVDLAPAVIVEQQYSTPSDFYSNFPRISPSSNIGNTVVTNVGDMPAWPTWTLTGPMTSFTAENYTTGKNFTFAHALGTGETAIITTDPPSVRSGTGVNLLGSINWPSATLWPMLPDDNEVHLSAVGASTGSTVRIEFNPRYEGC